MNKKQEDKIRKLVDTYISEGYSSDLIEKSFVDAGYNKEEIDKFLGKVDKRKLRMRKINYLVYAVPLLVILVVVAVFFFFSGSSCEDDLECFQRKADECSQAKGYFMLEGNKIALETDECALIKEIVEFDESEPYEMIALLEGRQMICSYEEGNFNPELLTLAGALELCDGELKDSLLNIRLAQLELES
jgi:hypothetical protein